MLDGVEQTFLSTAMGEPVITWILREDSRVCEVTEKSERCLKAIVVVDNTACGPAIGGVRMAPDVTAEEACRLARAMTLKNAAAGLPHGGGKSAIVADPKMPPGDKEHLNSCFRESHRRSQ